MLAFHVHVDVCESSPSVDVYKIPKCPHLPPRTGMTVNPLVAMSKLDVMLLQWKESELGEFGQEKNVKE